MSGRISHVTPQIPAFQLFVGAKSQPGTLSSPGYCNGNASLMPACLLSPLQDVAGDFVMAACACDPSSLIFWVLPFSFIFPVVSRFFQACPHTARASFSPLLHLYPLLLSISISLISYAFRFPARSSSWISPPVQEKIPKKPFSFFAHLLPKFCFNCWAQPCILLCSQNTTPPTHGICILQTGWTILVFFDFFFFFFII